VLGFTASELATPTTLALVGVVPFVTSAVAAGLALFGT